MGEANKRGSFERRQQLAVEREAVKEAIRKKAEQDRRSAWLAEKAKLAAEQDAKGDVLEVGEPPPRRYSAFGEIRPRRSLALATAAIAVMSISAMNTKGRP
jgi:hypothetical protein